MAYSVIHYGIENRLLLPIYILETEKGHWITINVHHAAGYLYFGTSK